jgi:hypothetical protein
VRFARHVAAQIRAAGPTLVAIGDAVSAGDAVSLEQTLRAELGNIERLTTAELGTALGVHGGPGTLVVSTQPYVNPASLTALNPAG